jgi:hypothetical protein
MDAGARRQLATANELPARDVLDRLVGAALDFGGSRNRDDIAATAIRPSDADVAAVDAVDAVPFGPPMTQNLDRVIT